MAIANQTFQKTFLILLLICCVILLEMRYSLMKNSEPSNHLNSESLDNVLSYFNSESLRQKQSPSSLFRVDKNEQKRQIPKNVMFSSKPPESYHGPKTTPSFETTESTEQYKTDSQLDWQPVNGSKYKFSVYSAYSYVENEVTIIAATKTYTDEAVICAFHNGNVETRQNVTQAQLESMDEHWNKTYAGTFIRCPLPVFSDFTLPQFVSVAVVNRNFTKNEDIPQKIMLTNILPIRYKSKEMMNNPQFNFSVCVLPAFSYNEVFHFLEWFEFYKLMGVNHFTLYNITMGPSTSCILNDLAKSEAETGIKVKVRPWHAFPIKANTEIRSGPCGECGLSAATNECIYRHKGYSKYMVFVDFDEFILPRSAQNFEEMIKSLDLINKTVDIGEYSIRNGFFGRFRKNDELRGEICEDVKEDVFSYQVCKHLFLVKKSSREMNILEHSDRSKYIVKPEGVIEGGNHHVMRLETGYETLVAPPEVVISRHYRFVEGGWYIPNNTVAVPDRIPKSFAGILAKKVAEQVGYFVDKCDLDMSTIFRQKD